jgi:hypothetical protein
MSDNRAAKCGLPTGESKEELSKRWLEGVTQALILDNVRILQKSLLSTVRPDAECLCGSVSAKSELGSSQSSGNAQVSNRTCCTLVSII